MEGVTEGRIVHYVPAAHDHVMTRGEHRAAMIVKVWDKSSGYCNLQVFCDGFNDGKMVLWATSIHHDPDGAPGTWHWIERA